MDRSNEVLDYLRSRQIPFSLHRHEPVQTMEDCYRALPDLGPEAVICKNAVLCNRQQTQFYLLLLDPRHAFGTSSISRQLSVSRLSFAPPDCLPPLLGLEAGAASPLGLIFDLPPRVRLLMDRALSGYTRYYFHPCINTAMLALGREDFLQRFLAAAGHACTWVDCTPQDET